MSVHEGRDRWHLGFSCPPTSTSFVSPHWFLSIRFCSPMSQHLELPNPLQWQRGWESSHHPCFVTAHCSGAVETSTAPVIAVSARGCRTPSEYVRRHHVLKRSQRQSLEQGCTSAYDCIRRGTRVEHLAVRRPSLPHASISYDGSVTGWVR